MVPGGMTEADGRRRLPARLCSLVGVALAFVCAFALAAGPARAKGDLLVPGVFQLSASNGYTFDVLSSERSEALLIYVFAHGKGVRYVAPATVTETSMQANLGALGEISVTFKRTNQPLNLHCGKRTIPLDSGQYEGTIDFHGEEGYTSVEATTAPQNLDFLSGFCSSEVFSSGPSEGRRRGAELYVRNPGLGPHLSVAKHRPGAAAWIETWMTEYTNGISITRYASRWMPGGDFTYDRRRLRTATIRPPAPFAGSAHFDLGEKAGQRWSGNLTVDLPGRTGVPLIGPTLRAYLVPSE